VPVQVHGMDADPYPGEVHLLADSSLPSYDQHATELMTGRILEFLSARGS